MSYVVTMGVKTMISVIGANIKRIRTDRQMSAYELAKKAGVGGATISQIESGKRATLMGDTLEKVANALGVTSGELLGNDETLNFETNDIMDIVNIINYADGLTLNDTVLTKEEKQIINVALNLALTTIKYNRLN